MTAESPITKTPGPDHADLDRAVAELVAAKTDWAKTPVAARIAILNEVRDCLTPVAAGWAETAAQQKQIPEGSALSGEEWISGPYALLCACDGLLETLSKMDGKTFLSDLKSRETVSGQLAVTVLPHNTWERLLYSGIKAEVWMEPGITSQNLSQSTASAYDIAPDARIGKIALVLGAGNIAAIPPLDALHKLFNENQVVILKMNPLNDYLTPFLTAALMPLIKRDALRIVKGGIETGAYLCAHPDIAEIHITGAQTSHDAIVWGPGAQGVANKKNGTLKLTKRVTSELGAVCPTIVVPGDWSASDIAFQAEHIATQKLHNSGFNCVACQMLILPKSWDKRDALMQAVTGVIHRSEPRGAYYPGASDRLAAFASHSDNVTRIDRGTAPACLVAPFNDGGDAWFQETEVFAPALSTHDIDIADPATYLKAAIAFANDNLHGTLGANILIHPATIRAIGKKPFEAIIADLRYGCITVNGWAGMGFLLTGCTWGAFPGHTLADVQSGIGHVHNTFMFDRPERVVITAPFRAFPRPPWFITNRRQHTIGRLMMAFKYRPSWAKLPRIFWNALRG